MYSCSLHDIKQTTPCSGSLLSGSRKQVKSGRIEIQIPREEWQEKSHDFCIIMNTPSNVLGALHPPLESTNLVAKMFSTWHDE